MERWTWLVTIRWNCVKLTWAFINILNAIRHCGILHNLSKDNIMLHFLVNKPNVVYIGMCDWGETKGLQKMMPSLYGFAKEQDAICHNPSLGLPTKARACKGAGQEWSSGITFYAHRNVGKCEGMNPHTPKWTLVLGVGVSMDSWIFRAQLQG